MSDEQLKQAAKKTKKNLLIVLSILLIVYCLVTFWIISNPPISGYKTLTYPHDDLVALTRGISYIMPAIFLIVSIIITISISEKDAIKYEESTDGNTTIKKSAMQKKIDLIKTIIIFLVIIIPIGLKFLAGYINDYDHNHYPGTPYNIWKPVQK